MINEIDGDTNRFGIGKYSTLRTIASDIIKFSIVAYGIGFLIVNFSFLEYGYMSFDIATTRYLLSGILFFAVCSLILLVSYICRRQTKTGKNLFLLGISVLVLITALNNLLGLNSLRKNIIYDPKWLFGFLYALITVIPFFAIFLSSLCKTKKIKLGIQISLILLPVIFYLSYGSKEILSLGLFILLVLAYEDTILLKSAAIKKEFDIDDLNTPRLIIFRVIGLFFLPILFGTQIYPNVERMRGGGAPLSASINIQEEFEEIIKINEKEFLIDFNNIKLILENRDSIFIGIENLEGKKAALEIPKKNIVYIKYKKRKNFFSKQSN